MCKFKTCWQTEPTQGELNSGEILVTENTCMSVREILERFAKGIPVNEQYREYDEGTYISEEEVDSIQSPDYSADKADMAQYVKDTAEIMKRRSKSVGGDDGERAREREKERSEKTNEREKEPLDPPTDKGKGVGE